MSEVEWRACFSLFDSHKAGKLLQEDFLHCIRACGGCLTPEQEAEIIGDIGPSGTEDDLVRLMNKGLKGPTEEDLLLALQAFDNKDNGSLSKGEFESLICNIGQPLSKVEARKFFEILKEAETKEGWDVKATYAKLTQPPPTNLRNVEELAAELGVKM